MKLAFHFYVVYKHYLTHTLSLPGIEKPPALDRRDVGREIFLFNELQIGFGLHANACQLVQQWLDFILW